MAILLGLSALIVSAFWQVFVGPLTARQQEIEVLVSRLAEMRSAAGREGGFRQQADAASATLHRLDAVWPDANRIQSAARIQDILRSAARAAGGQIVSSSAIEADRADANVAVRARIEGPLATLAHVLDVVQANRPRLFLDRLSINAPAGASTPARQQRLSFEIAVRGVTGADAGL